MTLYVRAGEAAHQLGVRKETLYAYVSRGLITKRTAVDGRTSLYSLDDITALAARGRRREGGPRPSVDVQIASAITTLDEDGPRYRGHDVAELARTCRYEQVAELLWTGELPASDTVDWPAPDPDDVAVVRAAVSAAVSATLGRTRQGRTAAAPAEHGVPSLIAAANALGARTEGLEPAAAARRLLGVVPAALSHGQPADAGEDDADGDRRIDSDGGSSDDSNGGIDRNGGIDGDAEVDDGNDRDGSGTGSSGAGGSATSVASAAPGHAATDDHHDDHSDDAGPGEATCGRRRRGLAAHLATAWTLDRPGANASDALVTAIERALILLADHELATSALAVRLAGSVRAGPFDAFIVGLAVVSGPAHGGAAKAVVELLSHCEREGVAATVEERLARGERIPGFGHKIYAGFDPRLDPLLEAVAKLETGETATAASASGATGDAAGHEAAAHGAVGDATASLDGATLGTATGSPAIRDAKTGPAAAPRPDGRWSLVEELMTVAGERLIRAGRAQGPNVDLGVGGLLFVAGLPATTPLFAVARIAGMAAHLAEELDEPPVRYRGMARSG